MSIATVLCLLRQRLLDSIATDDRKALAELKTTFTILKETLYDTEAQPFIPILVAFEDAARDGVMRVAWKSDIPSVETIQAVLSVSK